MSEPLDLEDARQRYKFALAPEDCERLPFYHALAEELSRDALAVNLLAAVRPEQRNPMLVLASLHLAALRGHPVLTPLYEQARRHKLAEPAEAAKRVLAVLHESPALVRDELWRSTQTNEPGRSAVLQAVIADLAGHAGVRVNVIDIGTSAGINLYFDQFRVLTHDDGDPLTLHCDDLGTVDRSRKLPEVTSRIGIDLHPLHLSRASDRLWLRACLWPEERRRHVRFDAVVAAQPSWPPATLLEGRALDRLDDAFALTDRDALTIVVNTWVAVYFGAEERRDYFEEISRRCHRSNVAWISVESAMLAWPGIDVPDEPRHRNASRVLVSAPGSTLAHWGWCHAHGRWLERTTLM